MKNAMKNAIEKAIEGGWDMFRAYITLERTRGNIETLEYIDEKSQLSVHKMLLDPLFWQALGKAMIWPEKYEWTEEDRNGCGDSIEKDQESWLYNWHRFIDHIASGGDAESFFNDLLK